MKTIKILESTHKLLTFIKTKHAYKTLDETIDMCIGSFMVDEILDPIEQKYINEILYKMKQ